jgi:hypothetical protein
VAFADGGSGNDEVVTVKAGTATGGSGNDILDDLDLGAATLNGGSGRDTCDDDGDDTLISCEKVG